MFGFNIVINQLLMYLIKFPQRGKYVENFINLDVARRQSKSCPLLIIITNTQRGWYSSAVGGAGRGVTVLGSAWQVNIMTTPYNFYRYLKLSRTKSFAANRKSFSRVRRKKLFGIFEYLFQFWQPGPSFGADTNILCPDSCAPFDCQPFSSSSPSFS